MRIFYWYMWIMICKCMLKKRQCFWYVFDMYHYVSQFVDHFPVENLQTRHDSVCVMTSLRVLWVLRAELVAYNGVVWGPCVGFNNISKGRTARDESTFWGFWWFLNLELFFSFVMRLDVQNFGRFKACGPVWHASISISVPPWASKILKLWSLSLWDLGVELGSI